MSWCLIARMGEKDMITVLDGALKLRQIDGGFKTSIDAVLLAAACPAKPSQSVLDLGCGIGSASLSLLSRLPDLSLLGIDIQADHIDHAIENATLNNLSANFKPANIQGYQADLVDHIICNPPYEDAGAHLISPSSKNATARGHLDGDITVGDWVKCAFNNLKSGGSLTIIHKAEAMQRIILALGKSFGHTEIIPLWPKDGKAAKRVIIRTIKHRKSPSIMHQGLVLHTQDGTYTQAAEAILRGREALK